MEIGLDTACRFIADQASGARPWFASRQRSRAAVSPSKYMAWLRGIHGPPKGLLHQPQGRNRGTVLPHSFDNSRPTGMLNCPRRECRPLASSNSRWMSSLALIPRRVQVVISASFVRRVETVRQRDADEVADQITVVESHPRPHPRTSISAHYFGGNNLPSGFAAFNVIHGEEPDFFSLSWYHANRFSSRFRWSSRQYGASPAVPVVRLVPLVLKELGQERIPMRSLE